MNYLKNYNINDEQILNIKRVLEEREINIDIFKYDPEAIIQILNLFISIGVNDLYNLIIESPSMFCDTVESIKRRIDKYEDKEKLARLLNEDASNLSLIDLI